MNGPTSFLGIRVYDRRKFTKCLTTVCKLIEILMTYVTERLRVLVIETQFVTSGVECNSGVNVGACSKTVMLYGNALTYLDNTTVFREQKRVFLPVPHVRKKTCVCGPKKKK